MRDDEGKARRFAKYLRQSMTDAEVILWSRLRRWPSRAIKFRRQHPIGIYIADFAVVSARLVIEVDGATHSSDAECTYDKARETYLRKRGWRVLRVQVALPQRFSEYIFRHLSNIYPRRAKPAHRDSLTFARRAVG